MEEKIEHYGRPQVEVVQQEPTILKVTIPLPPKVELGDYKKLKTKQKKVKVTAKQVDEALEGIRQSMATWLPVERPAKDGDMLIVDLESSVEDKPFIKEKGTQYRIETKKASYLKGLSEALVGMKAGDEKTFDIELGEDYPLPKWPGKPPVFRQRCSRSRRKNFPLLMMSWQKRWLLM
jgi:trigger factor